MDTPAQAAAKSENTTVDSANEVIASVTPDTTEEGAVETQAAPDADAKAPKKEEKKSNKKKLKFKVDNEEFEDEIDLDNDEELKNKLQYSKVAQKRMQQYTQLEKDVMEFVEALKKNPKQVLADPRFNLDLKQLAAEIIEEEVVNSKKSPEQLEKEKLEGELQRLKTEREKEKEDFRKRELTRLQEQEFERYDMLMTKALEKSDLPKSPYIVKKMADYMLLGLNNNIEVAPEDVLPLVREEITQDLKDMFSVMPDEVIEAIIGKDIFTRIRKKNIAKAKQAPTSLKAQIKDSGQTGNQPKVPKGEKKSFKEFFDF